MPLDVESVVNYYRNTPVRNPWDAAQCLADLKHLGQMLHIDVGSVLQRGSPGERGMSMMIEGLLLEIERKENG